jgi:LacI family transcriptional regulator
MAVDLRAVAARSSVSVATASRALSGSPRVSPQTRARVRSAALELGYRPNANARALRTARSRFVGLVITNLVNASFHVIAELVQQRLAERGYQMVLAVTGGDPAQEREALRMLADHSAEGVIVVGSDSQATDELHRMALPVVHLARKPAAPAGDCVLGDDLAGARGATAYLAGLGHRRIAVVRGPGSVTSGRERMRGYRLGMQDAGLQVRDELVIAGPFTPDTGRAAVTALLGLTARRRPTALLVANHEAAYGVLPALRHARVDVPGELSLVCYEDAELMRWWHPGVTVVDINAPEMGELAARLLLDRIDGTRPAGTVSAQFRVGTRLLLRASCDRRASTRRAPAGRSVGRGASQSLPD